MLLSSFIVPGTSWMYQNSPAECGISFVDENVQVNALVHPHSYHILAYSLVLSTLAVHQKNENDADADDGVVCRRKMTKREWRIEA
jgi:hypothetical protein